MTQRLVSVVLALGAVSGLAAADDRNGAAGSVVRVVTYSQRANWSSPWEMHPVTPSSGSGFVVAGGLVMTNAHVVSDAKLVMMFLHNDPNPHEAEVHQIAHDSDLALLRPKESGVLEGIAALELGPLPALGSDVVTLGYPVGGTRLSSTRGVVSRIEARPYVHSGADRHVTVQTDAAINPGNSGGPVIQNGQYVGVAFQASPDLQSVGYFIPPEVIERFLTDVEDGRYDGYPELGTVDAELDNPAARREAGVPDGETGVRIDRIWPGSSAEGIVQVGDVVLAVDGRPVANDGTVADGDERLPFGMLVDRRQVGEQVELTVLRDGRRLDLTVTLERLPYIQSMSNAYDRRPRYYVYGGLIFVPLELEMLKTSGADYFARADRGLLYEFFQRPRLDPDVLRRERVVVLGRLDHPVNADLAWHRDQVIERVNGRSIDGLEDLISAIESNQQRYHVFELSTFRRIAVLDRDAADKANPEILERYGVGEDRHL